MTARFSTALSILGLLILSFWNQATARTWTDLDGRQIEAELISKNEENIVVRLKSGKQATVPLTRLSDADREYLENLPATEDEDSAKENSQEIFNWDAPWPEVISFENSPEITIVEENAEETRFIYTSANYRFTCDVRLSASVVGTFADMFEATRLYCRALPLSITGGVKQDGKYDILLFETRAAYVAAGGPPRSGGVFMSRNNVVMVPLSSLGVRKVGKGYMRDRDKSDGTLIHEITHQLTPRFYYHRGARGWFSEGLAEYVTATPYNYGRFRVKSNFNDIVAYATARGKKGNRGRRLGTEFTAPHLEDYMLMSYQEFTGGNPRFNYGFGLVLTTYFLHLDGEGDAARMKKFLKQLRTHTYASDPMPAINKLLDGRTFEELQDDVSKAWKRRGIKISFRDKKSG